MSIDGPRVQQEDTNDIETSCFGKLLCELVRRLHQEKLKELYSILSDLDLFLAH